MSEHCGRVTNHTKRRGRIRPCSWCGEKIVVGERYATWAHFCDGRRDTVCAHEECAAEWMAQAREELGGVLYADMCATRPERKESE